MVKKHEKVNKEKKKDTSGLIIGIIIAVVIIAFVSAVFVFKPGATSSYKKSDYKTYHGFEFTESGQYWITQIDLNGVPYEAPFYNHPLELDGISYDDSITPYFLDTGHVSITIAVNDNVGSTPVLAGLNIGRITGKLYGVPTSSALYATPQERDENVTKFRYVDCSDATQESPIIWIHVNDTFNAVYRDQSNPHCIIVGGVNNEELLKSSDMLAYRLLEII